MFPLQATQARLAVGAHTATARVSGGSTHVTLTLDLPAGPARMQTWLENEAAGQSRGAFYVEVRRLD